MTTETAPRTASDTPWPAGRPPQDYVLGHVRAVLADRIVDDAHIVVREGRIAEIGTGPRPCDLDGHGLLALPGIIDLHSDALERERSPRPSAVLPWDFALASFEGRISGAGITTMFHGAGFQHKHARGVKREPSAALELCHAVDAHSHAVVDHRVLHRLDVLSELGAQTLRTRLDEVAGHPTAGIPLVSHEDHPPGQGQYVDPSHLVTYMVGADGPSEEEAWAHVEKMRAEGEAHDHTAPPIWRGSAGWPVRDGSA